MLLGACMRSRNRATHFFPRVSSISNSFAVYFGNCREVSRSYNAHFLLDEVEEAGEDVTRRQHTGRVPFSLAKSLACLQEEFTVDRQKPLSRMEQKRLIELRIKKKVKAQFLNGKFHDLMGTVVANPDSLRDAYDIICLNSNVDLASRRHDVCFNSLAEQLESGDFDIEGNTIVIIAKGSRKECLVLPRLKLKVIQEAIRVVLEVVFRPHFSKISHGCRSGRGCRSALRFICEEIGRPDWCFTIPMNKEANGIILSKLILEFKEKIEDAHLISFIQSLFNARVLNMVFGGYPKGHGLPQEGVLSPILMNIYLDVLDRELFRISMRYEALRSDKNNVKNVDGSNLRRWFQRQIKDRDDTNEKQIKDGVGTRIFACRYMDEIFIAIFGSKDVAQDVKTEVIAYLNNSLFLDVEDKVDLMTVSKNSCSLQFAGTVVRVTEKESTALKAVHKLKDKVSLFASQKQEIWDAMNLRIGKKWLAHGLRRIKESEIKQLGLSSPLLDHISQFRKEGMKTDHWFKSLLNIWMQDIKAKTEANEDVLLSKQIAEPALPQDLRDSFYNFQIKAKEYVSSESAATLALLNCSTTTENIITKMEAPIKYVKKSLYRYGLMNIEGFSRHVSALVLQDDTLIINWFSGLVKRWLRWYSEFDNFEEIKLLIVDCVRKSCIRTLAAKYRMHEVSIEKRFELDQHGIPTGYDLETEMKLIGYDSPFAHDDEALMYGISHSGLCLLSLSRVRVPTRVINCFVMGCMNASPSMYTLHVKEKQRFPGWKTGFAVSIHASLNGKRIGLCSQHVKDLYLGNISLQSIEFGALS
ncbi:uncharacterized protein LOC109724645 [Ananas comosus]|uniref:Uncharacterized protein LOC109724645 n=1 Tax=Ananas comosus TaxID=4615 RepID=A0A6P5GKE3_ANACO|nr:uncharacterized protein LOC109724645 [Ananas comosus]